MDLAQHKLHPMIENLLHIVSWAKIGIFAVASAITGWLAGEVLVVLQVPQVQAHWYEQPAFTAGLVAGVVTILGFLFNNWNEKRKLKAARESEQDKQHLTYSETLQQVTLEERKGLIGQLIQLHEKEINILKGQAKHEVDFWMSEFSKKSRETYEARLSKHAFANEVNHLHQYIHVCHIEMAKNNVPFPEIKMKSYEEMMAGVEIEMGNFKDTLPERYEKAMQADDEKK